MGFLDSVFGSDSESETESLPTLSPEQQATAKALSDYLTGAVRQPGAGYQGPLTAPLSNAENLSLAALEERSRALAAGGDNDIAVDALNKILTRDATDVESFFKTNIQQPAVNDFSEVVRPALEANFADQFFGSARRDASQNADEELIKYLTQARTETALRGREQDTNAILQALSLAPTVNQAGTTEQLNILNALSTPRDVAQGGLDREFQRFLETQRQQNTITQLANQFVGTPHQENITTVTEGSGGLLGGFLSSAGAGSFLSTLIPGAAGSGAASSAASLALLSDRRLKTAITSIGKLAGLTLYHWVWTPLGKALAGDQPTIGFMSDEVRAVMPNAVIRVGGYDRVNYNMILGSV